MCTLCWTKGIFKTFLSFYKTSSYEQDRQRERKFGHGRCWGCTCPSRTRNSPGGNPGPPAGRWAVPDACRQPSERASPRPRPQKPKRQQCRCNFPTPNAVQTVPCPLEGRADSPTMPHKSLDLRFRTSLLPCSPQQTGSSGKCSGQGRR